MARERERSGAWCCGLGLGDRWGVAGERERSCDDARAELAEVGGLSEGDAA